MLSYCARRVRFTHPSPYNWHFIMATKAAIRYASPFDLPEDTTGKVMAKCKNLMNIKVTRSFWHKLWTIVCNYTRFYFEGEERTCSILLTL